MTRGGGERGKADMHLHTLYSDGTASVQALLDHVERRTDLDLIAITDHERIDGALRARELHAAGDYSFELVVGEEITTRRGHVLALFITERIPALRPLAETLERIHDQGGIAIAAHPMAPLTPSLGTRSLRWSTRRDGSATSPRRASSCMNPSTAGRARRVARDRLNAEILDLPAVGNSDAHVLEGDRLGLDLVPRLDGRRLPRRHRGGHDRAGRRRTGRTSTTSTSTGASWGPRSATCGILCGLRESGGDIGPGARGARRPAVAGAAGRRSRSGS